MSIAGGVLVAVMHLSRDSPRGPAFTLVELLVVVAIIGLLVSLLLPALGAAKQRARLDLCMSNLRQLAVAFHSYAAENRGMLPGSTWDYISDDPHNPTYDNSRPLCWLGTLDGWGDRDHVPFAGTLFELAGRDQNVYKCPVDKFDRWTSEGNTIYRKPRYSYTAPVVLTGAPLALLVRTRWPEAWQGRFYWWRDWDKALACSPAWMIVEEDEYRWLARATDSAWSNWDTISDRHQGRGCIAQVDGSVSVRSFQRQPDPDTLARYLWFTAWKAFYDLADGRLVTAGSWGERITFGYLRRARAVNE